MSRTLRFSLALAALLAVLVVLWIQSSGGTSLAPPLVSDGEKVPPKMLPEGGEMAEPDRKPATAVRVEAREAALAAESTEPDLCVVMGRVLDESGASLGEVEVRLEAYKFWAEGLDLPRLEGPYDMRGFRGLTNAEGEFRFEVPVPTARVVSFKVRLDRFHDSYWLRFGTGDSLMRPPLAQGLRDLGEIRLATTGALRGHVLAENGEPLVGVRVSIGPGRSTTFSRDVWSAEDGTYVVGHAPIGTYAIKAKLEGYLSGYFEPVTVEARRDTDVVDFVLKPAPTIEGIVLDETGLPLAGVELWGWPQSSGSGAGGMSGADGRFVIYLPQDEPYSLDATLDGFRKWGEQHDGAVRFPAGTRDLEIVLEQMALTRFAVVDAETEKPIEYFGLNILADNGSKASSQVHTERRRPQIRRHIDGVVEASAREGVDLFVIAGAGYLLATGDVEHDTEGEPFQTIRLRRGVTLRGRILRDGQPVVGVRVEVVSGGMIVLRADAGGESKTQFYANENSRLFARTDESGQFEITGLIRGTHRLTAKPQAGVALVILPLEVNVEGVQDLGDLELPLQGATIAGEVLLPLGVEPAGLKVYLGDWRAGVTAVVDESGRFRFEDLAAGSNTLILDGRPGELAGSEAVTVELTAAETTSVSLDARRQAMCSVTLTIELGGLSVKGCQVDLVSLESLREYEILGKCDDAGVVRGTVRAWGQAEVRVRIPGADSLRHPSLRLDLPPRGVIDEIVRFELASLRIDLPLGVALPENGRASLELTSKTSGVVLQRATMSFNAGGASNEVRRVEGSSLYFGALYPGDYELTLRLTADDAESVEVPLPNGRILYERLAYFRSVREVRLIVGRETALELE